MLDSLLRAFLGRPVGPGSHLKMVQDNRLISVSHFHIAIPGIHGSYMLTYSKFPSRKHFFHHFLSIFRRLELDDSVLGALVIIEYGHQFILTSLVRASPGDDHRTMQL